MRQSTSLEGSPNLRLTGLYV